MPKRRILPLGIFYLFALIMSTLLFGMNLTAQSAAEPITIAKPIDEDIRRVSLFLDVSPQEVVELRRALRLVTDLTLQDLSVPVVSELGRWWIVLDREAAASELQSLLESYRRMASYASTSREYRGLLSFARVISKGLEMLGLGNQEMHLKNWPSHPLEDTPPGTSDRMLELAAARNLIRENPVQAAAEFPRIAPLISFSDRAYLMRGLGRDGHIEDFQLILEQTMSDIVEGRLEINSATIFIQTVAELASDQFEEVIGTFLEIPHRGPRPPTTTVHANGRDLEMPWREFEVLSALGNVRHRQSDLVTRFLDAFPQLRDRLRPIGGWEGFTNRFQEEEKAHRVKLARPEESLISGREPTREVAPSNEAGADRVSELLDRAQLYYLSEELDASLGRQALDEAGRHLLRSSFEEQDFQHWEQVLNLYGRLEGELPQWVRRDLLATLNRVWLEGEQTSQIYWGIRRLRSAVYRTWLLTDFETAFKSLDELELPDRVNALQQFLDRKIPRRGAVNLVR